VSPSLGIAGSGDSYKLLEKPAASFFREDERNTESRFF
jgi:hypothetical protein